MKYTKEEHAEIKRMKLAEKEAATHKCIQCEGTRFKTMKKQARIFSCRKCGAVYQD